MRLITDIFAYCRREVPEWNTISISGYHIREAGSTAAQEIGLHPRQRHRLRQDAAIEAGPRHRQLRPPPQLLLQRHNNFPEEIAKFRAARRLWAKIMKERFNATRTPLPQMLRFHTQTAGSTLTAQQPEVNIVRTTVQALAAVLGGTQSLHTNSMDEAIGLPTESAATLALRTQQESGTTGTVDPLAGSYFVESLTDEIEARATALYDRIEAMGGAVRAIEAGFMQAQIEDAAYEEARRQESGESVVVGVNRFAENSTGVVPVMRVDPELEAGQRARLAAWKAQRDPAAVEAALAAVTTTAAGPDNLLPVMKHALVLGATVGEVSDALRGVFGVHKP
jgi:methylmalonyl-CoA mutase, N-terminal domain